MPQLSVAVSLLGDTCDRLLIAKNNEFAELYNGPGVKQLKLSKFWGIRNTEELGKDVNLLILDKIIRGCIKQGDVKGMFHSITTNKAFTRKYYRLFYQGADEDWDIDEVQMAIRLGHTLKLIHGIMKLQRSQVTDYYDIDKLQEEPISDYLCATFMPVRSKFQRLSTRPYHFRFDSFFYDTMDDGYDLYRTGPCIGDILALKPTSTQNGVVEYSVLMRPLVGVELLSYSIKPEPDARAWDYFEALLRQMVNCDGCNLPEPYGEMFFSLKYY